MTSLIPQTLRWAAWLALIYAVVILAHATVGQILTEWEDASDYPRGVIRSGGFILIAIGLFRRARWAWWAGVGMSSFLLVMGLVALGAVFVLRDPANSAVLPPLFLPIAIVATALLAAMLVFLAHPRTRAAFGRAQA